MLPPAHAFLETDRLVLRPHVLGDFDACAEIWTDPVVTRWVGGRPFTREEVWTRLLRYAGHWSLLGYGFWAVIEKSSGQFVGELGFFDFHRDMTPPFTDPEAGWVFATCAQGKGYASEAVAAALAWGEAHLNSTQTVCMIRPENEPSLRLAAKFGYREFGRTAYKDAPIVLLARASRNLPQ